MKDVVKEGLKTPKATIPKVPKVKVNVPVEEPVQ
jgi:hypothetical protein